MILLNCYLIRWQPWLKELFSCNCYFLLDIPIMYRQLQCEVSFMPMYWKKMDFGAKIKALGFAIFAPLELIHEAMVYLRDAINVQQVQLSLTTHKLPSYSLQSPSWENLRLLFLYSRGYISRGCWPILCLW